MSERAYRQRLEADLARWQSDGVITSATGNAIRATFQTIPEGVTIATAVAIVGGLLIAAAFVAFIAANWTEIARPLRFLILIAGILCANASGAWFAHRHRPVLADLAAAVGSIIFGAAIALTGQMYHLGEDFAGGMLLFAAGAMFSAALTGSRGSLAVALVAGCIWNGMLVHELVEPHMPFIAFWLVGAFLAVAWNSAVARHLVAVAAVSWWGSCGFGAVGLFADPTYAFATGVSLLLGGGALLASRGPQSVTALGGTLSDYGAFALALALAVIISKIFGSSAHGVPVWMLGCGLAAIVCAFAAAVVGGRAGPALAGLSIAIALAIASGW